MARTGAMLLLLLVTAATLRVCCATHPPPPPPPPADEPRWSSDADGWRWARCPLFVAAAGVAAAAAAPCVLRAPGRAGALVQYYVLVCPAVAQCNDVGLPWQAESGVPRPPQLAPLALSTSIELAHHPSGVRFSTDADGLVLRSGMVPDDLVFAPAGQLPLDDRLTWRAPVDPFCAAADGAAPACRGVNARVPVLPAPLCTSTKEACHEVAFAAVDASFAVTLACGATDFYGEPLNWLPLNATVGGGPGGDAPPRVLRGPCVAAAKATVVVLARETDADVQAQRVLQWLRSLSSMVVTTLLWMVTLPFRPLFLAYQALVCPPNPTSFGELVLCPRQS